MLVWGCLCSCGPSVVVADTDGADGSGGSGGDSQASATASTTVGTSASTSTATTVDPSDSTDASTAGDSAGSSDGASSSSGDPFECGCPEDVVIDFETPLERGFTPAEALAVVADLDFPGFVWIAHEGAPETILHLDVSYEGGVVRQGPGGSDGCLFLSAACDDGLIMDVVVHLTSDDGWLDWTADARLEGVLGESLRLWTPMPVDVGTNLGTLADHPPLMGNTPVTLDGLTLDVYPYGRPQMVWLALYGVEADIGFIELGGANAQ